MVKLGTATIEETPAIEDEKDGKSTASWLQEKLAQVEGGVRVVRGRVESLFRELSLRTTKRADGVSAQARVEIERVVAQVETGEVELVRSLPRLDHQQVVERWRGLPEVQMEGKAFALEGVTWIFCQRMQDEDGFYNEDWAIGVDQSGCIYWYKNLIEGFDLPTESRSMIPVTREDVVRRTLKFDDVNEFARIMQWEQDALGGLKYYNPQRDEDWCRPSYVRPKDQVCVLLGLPEGSLDLENAEFWEHGGEGPRFARMTTEDRLAIVGIKERARL